MDIFSAFGKVSAWRELLTICSTSGAILLKINKGCGQNVKAEGSGPNLEGESVPF